jgi:hypothetical protein
MAKNGAKGGGRRGAVRNRTQFRLPNGHYAKRNRQTGEILSIKADRTPYKGVVIEKHPSPDLVAQALATPRRARVNLPALPARPAWRDRPAGQPAVPAQPTSFPRPLSVIGSEQPDAA